MDTVFWQHHQWKQWHRIQQEKLHSRWKAQSPSIVYWKFNKTLIFIIKLKLRRTFSISLESNQNTRCPMFNVQMEQCKYNYIHFHTIEYGENVIMILMDVRPQSNCMTKCNCNRNIWNYLVNFRFSWFVTTVNWLHADFNSLSVAIMFIVRFIFDVGLRFCILLLLLLNRGWAVVPSSIVTSLIYWAYLGGFNCSFSRGMQLFSMLNCCCL